VFQETREGRRGRKSDIRFSPPPPPWLFSAVPKHTENSSSKVALSRQTKSGKSEEDRKRSFFFPARRRKIKNLKGTSNTKTVLKASLSDRRGMNMQECIYSFSTHHFWSLKARAPHRVVFRGFCASS